MSTRATVVLGATTNEDRFAHRAMRSLQAHGEVAIPVNPAFKEVLGQRCYPTIAEVPQPIHTVTLYLGAARSEPLIPEILAARPERIILNPGAENANLEKAALARGIEVVHGCTLVMLDGGAY